MKPYSETDTTADTVAIGSQLVLITINMSLSPWVGNTITGGRCLGPTKQPTNELIVGGE